MIPTDHVSAVAVLTAWVARSWGRAEQGRAEAAAALFTWKLDATDVSRMAGHANVRITLDMYGSTAGVLERARTVTE